MRTKGDLGVQNKLPLIVAGTLEVCNLESFLHSKLGDPLAPCLADAALGREVRGPRGYCVKTAGELLEAWQHA